MEQIFLKFSPVKFPDLEEPTSPLRMTSAFDISALDNAPAGAKYTNFNSSTDCYGLANPVDSEMDVSIFQLAMSPP